MDHSEQDKKNIENWRFKMKNADSHLYLYAKGHYQKDNLIEDMKKILSERSNIPKEYIQTQDILVVLLRLTYKHIKGNEGKFTNFMFGLLPDYIWKFGGKAEEKIDITIIRNCLSILQNVRVKNEGKILIELDDPNPDILPLIGKEN